MAEDTESYTVRVLQDGGVIREETVTAPSWMYSDADRLADGMAGPFEIAVAQNSARYGIGVFANLTVDP
ncbi:hypothetical protein [Tateyamaria sp. Alg231-49]|uniref:hypothetical protein n=1 Tax=Tateyamaria sp. Alg231-49 TaxID=1922219 RepID=UPI00131F391F|nr:hypothetical protein [Tateyamaria sp. Alg231-49]